MTKGRIAFQIINYTVLTLLALICLFPLLNILAMSFSSATAVSAGRVLFFPVEFNTYAYNYVIEKREFWQSLLKSVERVCIGVPFTMLITILVAYPLSKESTQLRLRGVYAWIFFFTMLFSGGLIPGYLLIQNLHMMDTIWALILPMAVPVYNIVLMLNFFRGIPKELEEAAIVDGCKSWQRFTKIILPISKPVLASCAIVNLNHVWNEFLFANVFLENKKLMTIPLGLMTFQGDLKSDYVVMLSGILICSLPMVILFLCMSRQFVRGLTSGAVKG